MLHRRGPNISFPSIYIPESSSQSVFNDSVEKLDVNWLAVVTQHAIQPAYDNRYH